jgi:hypothetical protein
MIYVWLASLTVFAIATEIRLAIALDHRKILSRRIDSLLRMGSK